MDNTEVNLERLKAYANFWYDIGQSIDKLGSSVKGYIEVNTDRFSKHGAALSLDNFVDHLSSNLKGTHEHVMVLVKDLDKAFEAYEDGDELGKGLFVN